MRRFLFIGNGFDIAHDRATKYMDFLYACSLITGAKYDYEVTDEYKITLDKYAIPFKEKYGDNQEFIDLIKTNFYINYFIEKFNSKKENWIDFESEIKSICEKSVENDGYYIYQEVIGKYLNDRSISIDRLSEDLDGLITLLNAYLCIVDEHSVDIYYKEVLDFAPTDVISFNYSTTFSKAYYENENIDYVHGEINKKKMTESNIVLGFNTMEDKNNNVDYSSFLKQIQMVNKDVNYHILTDYEDTVEDLYANEVSDHYSMFFGHSLDKTDEDIIKIAFSMSKKIYLVYFSNSHKASMVKNILDIFGEKNFRKLCLSSKKKVFFIKQSDRLFADKNERNLIHRYFSIVNNSTDKIDKYFRVLKEIDVLLQPNSIGCYEMANTLKKHEKEYDKDFIDSQIDDLYNKCLSSNVDIFQIFKTRDIIDFQFYKDGIKEKEIDFSKPLLKEDNSDD